MTDLNTKISNESLHTDQYRINRCIRINKTLTIAEINALYFKNSTRIKYTGWKRDFLAKY